MMPRAKISWLGGLLVAEKNVNKATDWQDSCFLSIGGGEMGALLFCLVQAKLANIGTWFWLEIEKEQTQGNTICKHDLYYKAREQNAILYEHCHNMADTVTDSPFDAIMF